MEDKKRYVDYTPGLWEEAFIENTKTPIITAKGLEILIATLPKNYSHHNANSKLITRAPQMYELLKEIRDYQRGAVWFNSSTEQSKHEHELGERLKSLLKAIES